VTDEWCNSRTYRNTLIIVASFFATQAIGQQEHHASARGAALVNDSWTTLPTASMQAARSPGQPIRVTMAGGTFLTLTLQTPEFPAPRTLTSTTPGTWQIARSDAGSGGHLWVVATDAGEKRTVRASSHLFLPMKYQVPTKMLNHSPQGLQLIPLRLPEHGGIREGSTWRFAAHFDGTPLAGASIIFETAGNSRQTLTTDAYGIFLVTFPHDFLDANINAENLMGSRQNFVLAVRHQHDDHNYLTAYNHHYLPDRMRERSLIGGIGALFVGMALATPLLRRKEKKNA
jgi:hypothetical protein